MRFGQTFHAKDRLSDNFKLAEFLYSPTAVARAVPNTPADEAVVRNLKALVENVLQPLRSALHRPVVVTSGYRSRALNSLVGGVNESQHTMGEAADIYVPNCPWEDVFALLSVMNLPADQLIFENRFQSGFQPVRWLHVSHRRHGHNRREKLTQVFSQNAQQTNRQTYEGLFVPSA